MADALVEFSGDHLADRLDALNGQDEHDHDAGHHLRHEALVAVANAEIAEAAAAHRAENDWLPAFNAPMIVSRLSGPAANDTISVPNGRSAIVSIWPCRMLISTP